MADETSETIEDLQYDWPADVLRYESRFAAGLTIPDMLTIAVPAMVLYIIHPVLAIIGGLVGLLSVIRLEALGNRRVPVYVFELIRHQMSPHLVMLPLILPRGQEEVIITDLDGAELMRIEGE